MNYEQIGNEYYNAYKDELRALEGENLLLSLHKVIKTLFFILSIILSVLVSIYIKNNLSDMSTFNIREETSILSSKLNMTPEEFAVLVELIKQQN